MRTSQTDGTAFLGSCGDTETWLGRGLPECQAFPWRLQVLIETRKLLKADPANEILVSLMLRDGKEIMFLLMAFQVVSVLLLPEEWGKLL